MIEYVGTFFGIFFIDVFYIYYLRSVESGEALRASMWALVMFLIGSQIIIFYTENHWLIIPACLGTFCGTYVGMKLKNRNGV